MEPRQVLDIPDELIPEGKTISTIHGGTQSLEITIEKLKKFGFSGYILIKLSHDGYVSEGYLVVKDGNLEAAVYGRITEGKFMVTKTGEEALKLSWGDSYDKSSDLEVHGRLDINTILQTYPQSRLNVRPEKKVLKRRTRFSLEWGNNGNGQESAPEMAEQIPEELKVKLEDWKSRGYVVKFLQEEVLKNPANASVAFEQFESNLKRAEFLREELERLDCKIFSTDVERLKAMIKNPSKITAIEAALQGLKLKIDQEKLKDKEEKMAQLMAQIEQKPPTPTQPVAPEISPLEELSLSEPPEERLAGQGDIIPTIKDSGDRCTVCGAELFGKTECPTCGADNTGIQNEPVPSGDANLIPGYTFDNFVLGESNRFSHSAAMAVSKPGTSSYNPLFICSAVGLGKTHMLNAIGHFVISNYPDMKVLYMSTDNFINEFVDTAKNNRKKQFRKRFHDLDFLLLDDIQLISGNEAVQDELYHILTSLFNEGKQIVITCDRPIREMNGIKERLVSLFDSGLPTEIQPADMKTRHSILRIKAKLKRINVEDDVLLFIAERYRKSVRSLEGALKTLMAYSELMKAPLTLETAKLALKDELPEPREQSAEEVIPEKEMPFNKSLQKLVLSHSYLIEEDRPVKCFEYFVETLNMGMQGFAITRINPKRLKEQFDLGDATILWLTDKEGDADTRVVPVLEKIIYRIEDFLNTPGKSVLLLDGLDYLISSNNFDSVLRFLRRLIDEVSESDAILITSVTPETLDDQALNILEREMEILSFLDKK